MTIDRQKKKPTSISDNAALSSGCSTATSTTAKTTPSNKPHPKPTKTLIVPLVMKNHRRFFYGFSPIK
ncbi:hypothetical protein JCM19236_6375 [Vibrio sp. JCM 19236]|nr:hypothetical protein JCM19236_6375 [Vibrio sp. JCM 19236]